MQLLPFSRILDLKSQLLLGQSEDDILNSVRLTFQLRHSSELVLAVRARSIEEHNDDEIIKAFQLPKSDGKAVSTLLKTLLQLAGEEDNKPSFLARMGTELEIFGEMMVRRDLRGLIKVHKNFERPSSELEGLFESMANRKSFDFEVCPTYPELVLLPEVFIQQLGFLDKVRDFRVKGRIPVLVYIYRFKGVCTSLWRSGQIRKGIFTRWSQEDKEMIGDIGRLFSADPQMDRFEAKKTHIYDCRPFINAFGNKLLGKGYITTSNYDIEECIFGGIENIHVMRKAFEALKAGVAGGGEECKAAGQWTDHLRMILTGAYCIKENLSTGRSVLVNCSDGWDRTPQIVSLAKLLLDPYYRTFDGFRSLLYVDWISFGHKFATRQDALHSHESSPIFIQYLDCVHQLVSVLPTRFEFTLNLLTSVYQAYCDNCYEEFVYDSTEEYLYRHADELYFGQSASKPGLCLWEILERTKELYLNPDYEFKGFEAISEAKSLVDYLEQRGKEGQDDRLDIQPKEMKLKLWTAYV